MSDHAGDVWESKAGMSLRDYFAAAALPAMIATVTGMMPEDRPELIVAVATYQMADAMLAERGKADPLREDAHDLLAALTELSDAVRDGLCNSGTPGFDAERLDRALTAARAAIAKAKGGEG